MNETDQKLDDITSAVVEQLNDQCRCGVTSDNIDGALLRCFESSSLYVTYRARLSGTPDSDSHTLVSYLEDWVSGGPSITVQSDLMRIDSVCPVNIETFHDEECDETPVSQSSVDSTIIIAIIGGTVAVVVTVTIAVLLFALALVWRSCHGKLSIHNSEE